MVFVLFLGGMLEGGGGEVSVESGDEGKVSMVG